MRIVVTGAAGFIGSHLAERLLADGHEVVGVDAFVPYYPRAIKEHNLAVALASSRYIFFERDLRTDSLADVLYGVEAAFHEAAMPGLPASWTSFDEYMTCNLQGTQRLLEACRTAGVRRVVHASTSSVYGENATGGEADPTEPVSPYGVTKLAAEKLCQAYVRAFGLDVVICRYFSVFGPRQRPDMAYHIFARALLEERQINVFGDGQQSRGNTYVEDCVDGTVRALYRGQPGKVYNIGGGIEITLLEALQILEGATGRTAKLNFRPGRIGDQRRTLADSSLARSELGWEPRFGIEEGLLREARWIADLLKRGLLPPADP